MTKQPRKTRHSSSNCIHDIIGFICNYFLSYHDHSPMYIVEIQDDHFQPEELQSIEPIPITLVHTQIPIGILDRHKPPALFPIDVKISDTYVKIPDSQVKIPSCSKPLYLPPIPVKVPYRYKPLIFPSVLHDFPANYNNNLPRFDGKNVNITVEKHIQRFEYFLDLYEVEDGDVCIRMFSLYFQGEVKNWFKILLASSISNFDQFVKIFLDRWVIMRNVFLILEEYDHLKRHPGETIQHYSTRFNKVYHAMLIDIRPPLGLSHLHYPGSFNPKMKFQLRERNNATLEEIQKIAVDVEDNLLNRKEKLKEEEKYRI
jgi:hypothetical protein